MYLNILMDIICVFLNLKKYSKLQVLLKKLHGYSIIIIIIIIILEALFQI